MDEATKAGRDEDGKCNPSQVLEGLGKWREEATDYISRWAHRGPIERLTAGKQLLCISASYYAMCEILPEFKKYSPTPAFTCAGITDLLRTMVSHS